MNSPARRTKPISPFDSALNSPNRSVPSSRPHSGIASPVSARSNKQREKIVSAVSDSANSTNGAADSLGVAAVTRTLEEILGFQMPTKSIQFIEPISPESLLADKLRIEEEKELFSRMEDNSLERTEFNSNKYEEKLLSDRLLAENRAKILAMNYNNYINLSTGRLSLIQSAIDSRCDIMKKLIISQPIHMRTEFVNSVDSTGNPALFYCLDQADSESLQLLIDYGADPNLMNHRRNTALHICVALNHKRAIKTLIEHGANIQLENGEHQFPHQMAKDSEKTAAMQSFMNSVFDQHQLNLEEKKYFKFTPQQRGLYRSYFDLCDKSGNGAVPMERIRSALVQIVGEFNPQTSTMEYKTNIPDNEYIKTWFNRVNISKSGSIDFSEFLRIIQHYLIEKAKLEKKLRKKQLLAEKRARIRAAKAKNQQNNGGIGGNN